MTNLERKMDQKVSEIAKGMVESVKEIKIEGSYNPTYVTQEGEIRVSLEKVEQDSKDKYKSF